MGKAFIQWILRKSGWTTGSLGEYVPKCVICVAPHTSNWDLIIGLLFYLSLGRKAHFLIKKEWFHFPFNVLLGAMGGIPIDRSRNTSATDQMAEEFSRRQVFHLAITPEGTRKKTAGWKRGFYYIALKADVPILLAYIDYKRKEVGTQALFHPTGDADADMDTIREYYRGISGKHPANFEQV
jgi:1-acyl-sn-glycerol-3-phosphate acyltransferase